MPNLYRVWTHYDIPPVLIESTSKKRAIDFQVRYTQDHPPVKTVENNNPMDGMPSETKYTPNKLEKPYAIKVAYGATH